MAARSLEPLLDGGAFFETPRWHDGRWWVSDFYREAVYAVTVDGAEEQILQVAHQPSGLGWLPDGAMLVVSMKDQRVLRRDPDGTVSVHADLSAYTDSSLNDMVVDEHGRAWIGCFGSDRRRDRGLPIHGIHDRRGWISDRPARLGPTRANAPAGTV
jgi:sugar lactone lactonase YvrE